MKDKIDKIIKRYEGNFQVSNLARELIRLNYIEGYLDCMKEFTDQCISNLEANKKEIIKSLEKEQLKWSNISLVRELFK